MSNLFKKVRIVHSPEEKRYYIEQCRIWSWSWERIEAFEYVDVRNSSPHGCSDLSGDAFNKAKKKAEMLLSRTVVWEQSNYFWVG
jgi:hypothetical protein